MSTKHARGMAIGGTAAVLVAVLAVLAGCGGNGDDGSTSEQGVEEGSKQPLPGKEPGSGDHVETGTVTFSGFDKGLEIRIIGGGSGTSNCTRDETNSSFTTSGTDEGKNFSFVAKSSGSCTFETSWSNFKVQLRDPNQGGRVIATGIMWMGQESHDAYSYKADCYSNTGIASEGRKYVWDRMKCEHLSGKFDLKVSPGAKLAEGDGEPERGSEQTPGGQDSRQATAGPKTATMTFSVGSGMNVAITGGGAGGKSTCTKDETVASFTTKGDDEGHDFGYYAKGDGSCAFQSSYSYFNVVVKDATGKIVGSGDAWFGQNGLYGPFFVTCGPEDGFAGIKCEVTGDRFTGHSLKISRQ